MRPNAMYRFYVMGRFWENRVAVFTSSLGMTKSRDSSVGIALGYGLDDRGSRVRFQGRGWEFFSSPPRPERL
jgi:hypothetical protein